MAADRVIETRWVACGARTMDDRLDALRGRADFLAQKIRTGTQAPRGRDEREHAALMWAIAELSGIGDEYRQRAEARDDAKSMKVGKLLKRAEHAERLYADARLKIESLKARMQALNDEYCRQRKVLMSADPVGADQSDVSTTPAAGAPASASVDPPQRGGRART